MGLGLWRLLKRLKFARRARYFEVKRMPVGLERLERPAIERGWTGERAAQMLGGGRHE